MRPQWTSLGQAPYRSLLTPRRIPCGARSFAATTAIPLRGNSTRPVLSSSQSGTCFQHQRWITQKHIQRMKDGKKEWAGFAEEIKAGDRKNFAQHLEERGLIHDVVGYVAPGYNAIDGIRRWKTFERLANRFLWIAANGTCCIRSSQRSGLEYMSELTRLPPQCTSDTCFLSWFWPGDTSGVCL